MKQFFILSLMVLSLSSCMDNDKELLTLNLEERFETPAGLNNIETHIFSINDISSLLKDRIDAAGISVGQVESVKPGLATLEGLFGGANYANLDRVIIDLVDPNDLTNRKEIFFQESINFNHSGGLQLFGSLLDVKDLLFKDDYNLEIALNFRTTTNTTAEHRLTYNFVVNGK